MSCKVREYVCFTSSAARGFSGVDSKYGLCIPTSTRFPDLTVYGASENEYARAVTYPVNPDPSTLSTKHPTNCHSRWDAPTAAIDPEVVAVGTKIGWILTCGRIVTRNTGSNFLPLLVQFLEKLADALNRRCVDLAINVY